MKTVEEIYQEMLACFEQRSGMTPGQGCDLSVRLYALAAQIYALYVQADWVRRQAFPQTAEGEYLDRFAHMRSLERKEGEAAVGVVRFAANGVSQQERTIPAGTVCMTAGLIRFETQETGVLPAGEQYVDVPVRALTVGAAGNVGAGTITGMAVAPVGIASCINPQPCTGGCDEESDASLRERVMATFRRLPNGANAAYYHQEALSFDDVAAAIVHPRARGVGTVDVIVSAKDGVPDQELLDALGEHFAQRREIAVDVQVLAPETVTVDLAVQIAVRDGAEFEAVKESVEQKLREQFGGHLLGQAVLKAWLGNLVYDCDGVENYTISSPAADIAAAEGMLPVLGTLTVEEMA